MTDQDYYTRRAVQEVRLAERATHPSAVAAHYRLSTAYLDRLHPEPEERQPDRGA